MALWSPPFYFIGRRRIFPSAGRFAAPRVSKRSLLLGRPGRPGRPGRGSGFPRPPGPPRGLQADQRTSSGVGAVLTALRRRPPLLSYAVLACEGRSSACGPGLAERGPGGRASRRIRSQALAAVAGPSQPDRPVSASSYRGVLILLARARPTWIGRYHRQVYVNQRQVLAPGGPGLFDGCIRPRPGPVHRGRRHRAS